MGPMYPELYPELEGRNRKARGLALSLAGSFVFMVATVETVALSSQLLFLAVPVLSLGAVTLSFAAHRSRSFLSQAALLMGAAGTLAAETELVGMLFPAPLAAVCAVLTLGGCLVAAKGIAAFDVKSPQAWERSLKNHVAKSSS